MNVIDAIKEKMQKYPHVKYNVTENSVTVFPTSDSGFDVSLYFGGPDAYEPFEVYFNGWHEHFADAEQALKCFAFGLSAECRLKVTIRGGKPFKWTVEFLRDGVWHRDATTALFAFRFWKKKEVRYLQNDLIK